MTSVVAFPFHAPPPDMLIDEQHLLALRPCLSRAALRKARGQSKVRWTRGKRGSAWYRLADVDSFIEGELTRPCRNREAGRSLNLADNGSQGSTEDPTGTDIGLTPELESQTAEALARMI